jgi:hypothetical protein
MLAVVTQINVVQHSRFFSSKETSFKGQFYGSGPLLLGLRYPRPYSSYPAVSRIVNKQAPRELLTNGVQSGAQDGEMKLSGHPTTRGLDT